MLEKIKIHKKSKFCIVAYRILQSWATKLLSSIIFWSNSMLMKILWLRIEVFCRLQYKSLTFWIFSIFFKHIYLKYWKNYFVFDNFSVYYTKITQRKLTRWYATSFLFRKAFHDIFTVQKNQFWFLKNSSWPLPFTIFLLNVTILH
jgi:hypothetical protein